MASGIDYSQAYQQAEKAYIQGNYQDAAALIDRLAERYPHDPSVLLLRGHIYCYGLQQYDLARQQYAAVLSHTSQPDYVDYATNGLEYASQFGPSSDRIPSHSTPVESTRLRDDSLLQAMEGSPGLTGDRLSNGNGGMSFDYSTDTLTGENFALVERQELDLADGDFLDPFAMVDFDTSDPFVAMAEFAAAPDKSDGTLESFWSDDQEFGTGSSWLVQQDDSQEDLTMLAPSAALDLKTFPSIVPGSEPATNNHSPTIAPSLDDEINSTESNVEFLDEFSEFDDLGSLPDFQLSDSSGGFTTPSIEVVDPGMADGLDQASGLSLESKGSQLPISEADLLTLASTTDSLPSFAQFDDPPLPATPEQSWLGFLDNASLDKKNLAVALSAGLASTLAVGVISFTTASLNPNQGLSRLVHGVMALGAGITGFGAALGVGYLAHRSMKASLQELQEQFDLVTKGNLSARARVLSADEFGYLANSFNKMSRVILTTTSEAQRKA